MQGWGQSRFFPAAGYDPTVHDHGTAHLYRAIRTELRRRGAERMMVHLTSGFAERGFRTDPILAEARGPYLSKVAPKVGITGEKRADLEAVAHDVGVADAVSLPGLGALSEATPAGLAAPADPALWARALDFSEERSFPSISRYCYPGRARRMASLQRVGADLNASGPSAPARPV